MDDRYKLNGFRVLWCSGRWSRNKHLQCFGQLQRDIILAVSQFEVEAMVYWQSTAEGMIKKNDILTYELATYWKCEI